jgi:tripartite-type tricarboxylate transporter receptor subunit TctC
LAASKSLPGNIMPFVRRTLLAALAAAVLAMPALAQPYPSKPIHLIVPYPAGGGTDFFARLVGQKMQELIGQPVVVENKPGAATNLGAEFVAKARPDGYTILLGDVATFAANPSLYKKLQFDPEKDFAPISLTARFVSVLVANPSKLKVNSVAELIAAAKAEPGKIDIAHAGVGNPFHLAAVLFQQAAGIKLNEIPYRGAAPAVQDVLAGTVPLMFVDYATARAHLAAGTVKALGVAALEERRELPGVPPVAATPGLAGFEAWPWQGIVAPARTSPEIIAKLRDVYIAAVNDPVVRQKLIEAGLEPLQSTPQEFSDYRRKEAAKWAEAIKSANIQLD